MEDIKDKKPLSSKKFIAFFVSLAILATILIIALFTQTFGWPMVTFMSIGIATVGFLCIGYVLSVAALDKYSNSIKGIINVKNNQSDNPLE